MASTYNGVLSDDRWENLRRRESEENQINVGKTERLVSGVAGAALIAMALRRKRLRPILLPVGGNLISRAVTGRCPINRALGRNTARGKRASPVASVARGEGIKVERTVLVSRPAPEVYRFWRQLENLPRFTGWCTVDVVMRGMGGRELSTKTRSRHRAGEPQR